jgi:glucan phosphoethanolaminetransferase (alkaline phosphatase superfamily)
MLINAKPAARRVLRVRITEMQKILLILVLAIFLIHSIALWNNWYVSYPHLDIPMHMAGGAFLGLLFVYIFTQKVAALPLRQHPWLLFIFGLGFVALIGVTWEWYEYFSQVYIQKTVVLGFSEPGGLFDTLKDLWDDVFGGAVALAFTLHNSRRIKD